ncbi:hypothetical protein DV454_004573 [Geotrichum candidum]|nr:hypothetical protein DV454_004573 [Geotrichum candidum]
MLDKLLNAMVRSDEEDEEEDIQFIAGESASFEYSNHPANNNPVTPAANPVDSQITKKKRKKKKKKSSSETKSQEQQQQQQQQQQPSHSSQQSQHTPRVQHQHIHDQHDPKDKKSNDDKIWDTSTAEERQRINQFWLSLTEDERRELVKIDKDTVMEKMREQKRTNCNCTVCGRKRMAIEELESLYEAYNDTKSGDPDDDESRRVDHFNFGNNLTIKGGILTVAEDLLKNDGKKFIDMMESLAEKRMRREEEIEALAADYIWEGTEEDYDEDPLTSDEVEYDDDDDDDDDDDEDDLDDDDELDDDEDEEDNDDEEYDETVDNEESRWAESKRLLQMFAAKMFEQRVMAAYRERVANERQRKFLEELEEETRLKEEREAKKQRDKEKKKNKKRQQKLAKEEEKARREAEKAEAEAQLKAKQAEKQEEARRRKHEQKLKKEAERKQLEVEKRLKADEEKQKEAERKLEKQRRIQQEREAKETAKRLAEETAERKRQEQEQKAAKEAELIKKEAELAHQEAAKIKQQHQKQLLQQLQQHAQQIGAVNIVKGSESKPLTPIARKADPVLLASLQQSSLAKQQQQFQQQQQPSVILSGIGGGSTPNLSVDLLQQTTFKVYQHHAMRSADGFVPAHMLYRATIATLQAPSVSSAGPVNATAAATAAASETLNMQDFYHILGNSSAVMEGGLVIQLVRDNFGLVTQVKYVEAQQQPQTEQPMQYQQVHQQQQRYMYGGSSVIPNAAPATTVLPMGY